MINSDNYFFIYTYIFNSLLNISMSKAVVSINDFTDLVEIGHGAFGTVFKATYKKNKRIFALKRMQKSHLQKQNMISQINTQIKISMDLKHENIIKVFDCFQDQEYIYLVLELAENGQLYEKLRKVSRFDENTVKQIIKDVIAAVQYLHSRNPPIVHRDIKPENLLFDRNNRIKLAGTQFIIRDFGWSTVLNKPRKTYCGTVDYLAPEMIDKSGHDEKLDIWCIGVLVYELLTGRTPFLSSTEGVKNTQAVYDNILNMRIEFPSDFPTLAKSFVLGMIKRNPKQRMSYPQIKNHPWLQQKPEEKPIWNIPKTQSTKNIKTDITPESDNSQIIKDLKKKIRQLEEQNISYKLKIEDLEKSAKSNGKNIQSQNKEHNQINRLMTEVRRLKVVEQMNQKYKKKEEQAWEQINQKQKQIIKMKTDLKRVQDFKTEIQRLQGDKQKLQQKTKKFQRQIQSLEDKNRQLQSKLDDASSGFANRVKRGQKINKEQIDSPQFLNFLQDQIGELTQKFQQSKEVVSKMFEKQNIQFKNKQQLSKLRAQQKKIKEVAKAEARAQFENEKDDLLMKIRNQLTEEKEKWYKERQQLKLLYQQGPDSHTDTQNGKNSKEDLEGELKNVRELNGYYQKSINKLKTEMEDLKEELKRKK